MSTRFNALTKRISALAGTVALTAAALLAGAGAAAAAPAGPGNIDFDAKGTIVVHKHAQPDVTGQAGDGSNQGVLDNPLAGVEFTVQQLDIDLSDPEAWDGLASIDPDNPGYDTVSTDTLTTNGQGIAQFENLPVGVYLVTEGAAPADLGIVSKAAPFIVVIPTAIDGQWTYTVHAYPKNSQSQLEKELDAEADAAAFGQGDTVTWNISSTAPTLATNDVLSAYQVDDELDSRLGFVAVKNVTYDGTVLVEGTDYTVTAPAVGANGTVTVELTADGLAKVKNNSGKVLAFQLDTVVIGDIGNGVIPNEATQLTNVNGNEATIESMADETYWGNVNILKQDEANDAALAGAEFQVFATEQDALDGTNAISVNGVDTFVTDSAGKITISALNAGADQSRDYWIKETKAPAGYVLPTGANAVTKVTVVPGANDDVTYTVDNKKQDRPNLPLTGATGTMLFVAGGAALVAVALGVAARQRSARA